MAKTNPELIINQIEDVYLKRNFFLLDEYFKKQNQLLDFKFFSVKFTDGSLTQSVNHGLKFIPFDIILLGMTNNASVAFKVGLFTATKMEITVDKPCTLRFFAGKYFNQEDNYQPESTDKVVYGPNVGAV